jgi:hypothetical protein
LPHRTRLFRLFNTHRHWIDSFMADPSQRLRRQRLSILGRGNASLCRPTFCQIGLEST